MPRLNINNTPEFGFFGKLPINGDFIQRNLSQRFVHRWDSWLQNNLLAFQQHFGNQWAEHYLTSPIWRFFISPGVIDNHAYIGIMAPSVDRVGRYFPMTIAVPVDPKQTPALFSQVMQSTFADLESFFLKYLHAETANIDELTSELHQHSLSLQHLIQQQNIDPLPDTINCHRFVLSDQADLAGAVSGLWLMDLLKQRNNATLWWSNGSQSIEPSLLVNSGLPNRHQFISMLSGFDGNHHWRQKNLSLVINESPEVSPDTDTTTETNQPSEPPDMPPAIHQQTAQIVHEAAQTKALGSQPKRHTDSPPTLTPNKSGDDLPATLSTMAEAPLSASIKPQAEFTTALASPYEAPFESHLDSTKPATMKSGSQDDAHQDLFSNEITQPNYLSRENISHPKEDEIRSDTLVPLSLEPCPEPLIYPQSSAEFCDIGNRRQKNQDAILSHSNRSLWVVADGMGGHSSGEKASQAIVEQLSLLNFEGDLFNNIDQIKESLNIANRQILAFSESQQITCGSTVAILLRNENQCAYLWAGDSRLYLRRNNQLLQLTEDHCIANDNPAEERASKKHAITRAIGVYKDLDVENGFLHLEKGDRFLLCSDGLYGELNSDQINHGLSHDSPQASGEHLKKIVLEGEAKDNLSGILVWF